MEPVEDTKRQLLQYTKIVSDYYNVAQMECC